MGIHIKITHLKALLDRRNSDQYPPSGLSCNQTSARLTGENIQHFNQRDFHLGNFSCKSCRDFFLKSSRHTFALSNEKRSCRPMDRTLAYEAWNWGSSPHRNTEWSFGRPGVCAGLKILRTWFDSTRLHHMVMIVQMVRTPDCGSGGHGFEARSSP